MKTIRIGIFGLGRGASFINIIKSCGGEIVAVGTPEEVAKHPTSYTGKFLKKMLEC